MKRLLVATAILAVALALVYIGWPRHAARATDAPPAVTATAARASPTVPASATPRAAGPSASTPLPDLPASVSLDDGPPPLRLYRCAVYARLLASRKSGAEAAPFLAAADEMDSVITLLRDMGQQGDDSGSGDAAPGADTAGARLLDPEAVRDDIMARAADLGPRLDAWLEESYARCDQEAAWAHEAWGRLPGESPPAG